MIQEFKEFIQRGNVIDLCCWRGDWRRLLKDCRVIRRRYVDAANRATVRVARISPIYLLICRTSS